MSALLLNFLAVGTQYLCSVALILVCVLAGANIYAIHIRKADKPHAADKDPSKQDNAGEETPSEEPAEGSTAEPSEEEQLALPPIPALTAPDSNSIRGRYNKSFTAKLIQSPDSIKQYYVDLANELFTYDKVRNRISWANSSFYIGRKAVSKFSIRGKTLFLYLALDPTDFLNSKYHVADESAVKRYETVPLRMKVKSGRGVKFGKELIEILMQKLGASRSEGKTECVKLSDYPYDTTQNLLERGLVKLKTEEGQPLTDADSLIWADIERREQVSVKEAGDLISDEIAVSFLEETETTVLAKPKGIINIDTLSDNFEANETVTIESLKQKKLIGNSVNYVKVLARGVLNKPLIVKMPEFSVDAVKMILLTGGKAIKLKTERK